MCQLILSRQCFLVHQPLLWPPQFLFDLYIPYFLMDLWVQKYHQDQLLLVAQWVLEDLEVQRPLFDHFVQGFLELLSSPVLLLVLLHQLAPLALYHRELHPGQDCQLDLETQADPVTH